MTTTGPNSYAPCNHGACSHHRLAAHRAAAAPCSAVSELGVVRRRSRYLSNEPKTMKLTIVFAATLSLVFSVLAESPYERELTELTAQRDKALLAVSEPVYRRYRTSLEQLLRKAHQANDLDAAVKIKAQLNSIPATVQLAKPKPKTADELKEFLHGTTWNISDGSPEAKVVYTLTFNKNGTLKHSDGRTAALSFLGPRSIKLWNYDPGTFNEDLNQFRAQGSSTVYFGTLKP